MTCSDVSNGSRVFIDANTLVYHAIADPPYGPACKQLIERVARKEIQGLVSAHVLADLSHRVMTAEAMQSFGWPSKGVAVRLRGHPEEIRKLISFTQAVDEVSRIGIQVVPIGLALVSKANVLSVRLGLLTGDALIVEVMQENGLTQIAS